LLLFILKENRTYAGSMTSLVFIWYVNTLERTVTAHTESIFFMFSSDNCIVTSAKEEYCLIIFFINFEEFLFLRRFLGSIRTLNPVKV